MVLHTSEEQHWERSSAQRTATLRSLHHVTWCWTSLWRWRDMATTQRRRRRVAARVDGCAIRLRAGPKLTSASVVVWIPDLTTSTDRSRGALPDVVTRADAVHNLGRVAQFVLAIEHDDPSLLARATDDRLHQAVRLPEVPGAAAALDAGVSAGAWCGWLSGSGPTVAFLVDARLADAVIASLPETGHTKHLHIAGSGVHVLPLPE